MSTTECTECAKHDACNHEQGDCFVGVGMWHKEATNV